MVLVSHISSDQLAFKPLVIFWLIDNIEIFT